MSHGISECTRMLVSQFGAYMKMLGWDDHRKPKRGSEPLRRTEIPSDDPSAVPSLRKPYIEYAFFDGRRPPRTVEEAWSRVY